MKLGLLYPRSKAHPDMDIDFVNSLKHSIEAAGLVGKVSMVMEDIGNGGSEKEVYEKAARLIRIEGADLLVAFIDLKVTPLIEPLLFAAGKLMIVVNPGANYPQNWVPQPNIIYLTLQHSFLTWLTGGLAARQGALSAAVATTFYDCGYLHSAAMLKHFMQLGGMPAYNYVNNQAYDEAFEISPLLHFLSGNRDTNKLLCTFDTLPASLFYDRLNGAAIAEDMQLFVSPMMLESPALAGLDKGFRFSIDGFMPWHPSLGHEANARFMTTMEAKTGRPASLFSLLGWEAGLLLNEILQDDGGDYSAEPIVAHLARTPISSPRGMLQLDAETNYFIAPVVRCQIRKGATAVELRPSEHPVADWRAFSAVQPEGISSGWTNTYLCY